MKRGLPRVFCIDDLARLAQQRLPRAVFDFYAGGAEDELTLRGNRDAFAAIELVPRVGVDVSRIDTSAMLLGARAAMPLAIAPMGAVGFGRRSGDLDMARAAAKAGVPYVLSTAATTSIERIAEGAGGRLWFQLYPLKQREGAFRLVERAHGAGFEALVVTLDVPVGGKRERDLRNDFSMPFRYTPRNVMDFATRPRWAIDMLRRGLPLMENMKDLAAPEISASQLASSVGREFDPAFAWPDLQVLRERWQGKLIVKGILSAADAVRAAELGCDAVIVSNHGGRQLDGAVPALRALPGVVAAVGGRCEVFVDGGVRRGVDIVKAIASGAKGVLAGRAFLYGACAAGEPGVTRALDIFSDELMRTLRLCGAPRIGDVDASWLSSAAPARADL